MVYYGASGGVLSNDNGGSTGTINTECFSHFFYFTGLHTLAHGFYPRIRTGVGMLYSSSMAMDTKTAA